MLNLVSYQVENAFFLHQCYEALHDLASKDEMVLTALNSDALFWNTYESNLLTALFMTIGRLFESNAKATVRKLIDMTMNNTDLFSREALEQRKSEGRKRPVWLDDYMKKDVWTPESAEKLQHLEDAFTPHVERYISIYMPIRDKVYAHQVVRTQTEVDELFKKTDRKELGETL